MSRQSHIPDCESLNFSLVVRKLFGLKLQVGGFSFVGSMVTSLGFRLSD